MIERTPKNDIGADMSDEPVEFSISFVLPSDESIAMARENAFSQDIDCQIVSKAILDASEVTVSTRDAYTAGEANVDLDPYFDHWFGDSIEAATRLLQSDDPVSRQLAKTLISQEQAILSSKEGFLNEIKRVRDLGS